MTAAPHDIVPPLVDWYRRVARDLPWRANPTPYYVLLSELMCQQTRVDTALPYFNAFILRWPTVQDLAAASVDDVLHAWAGLGYYRRARSLHACAVEATRMGGIPPTIDGLRRLPGVGAYTSGAIASIAFGLAAAAVDGNVERVLSRLDESPEVPWSVGGKRALSARSVALHAGRRTGDQAGELTQAVMELGSQVCTPRRPRCEACPLSSLCRARRTGSIDAWPKRRAKEPPVPIQAAVAIIESDGTILMAKRPATGLLAGLWEPVMVPVPVEADPGSALARGVRERVGIQVEVRANLGTVTHIFSHRRLTATVFQAVAVGGILRPAPEAYEDAKWSNDPTRLALSTLARKLLALIDRPPLFLAAAHSRVASR